MKLISFDRVQNIMRIDSPARRVVVAVLGTALLGAAAPVTAWEPTAPVELVVPAGTGGGSGFEACGTSGCSRYETRSYTGCIIT